MTQVEHKTDHFSAATKEILGRSFCYRTISIGRKGFGFGKANIILVASGLVLFISNRLKSSPRLLNDDPPIKQSRLGTR